MRIMRMSGLPVQLKDLEAHKAEFMVRFDEAKEKAGNDMLALQGLVATFEAELNAKYSLTGHVELPKSASAWKKLMGSFEAPVMLAQSSENTKELVLVIVDQPIGT